MGNSAPQIGYALKQVQSLLHLRMEEALKPLDLTVSHYSCLFHLSREPGVSAAALARNTFVTRQSMNALLQQLIDRGLVVRPARAQSGRALPTTLSALGVSTLELAQARVDDVEKRMLAGLPVSDRATLARTLAACIAGLDG